VILLGASFGRADDTPKKPIGTWTKTAGDVELTFEIKADAMKVILKQGAGKVEASVDYSITKDGVLFGRVNKVEKTGVDGGPGEGDLFSFRFTVVDDKMTIDDLKGSKDSGEAKQLVEGEYKKGGK